MQIIFIWITILILVTGYSCDEADKLQENEPRLVCQEDYSPCTCERTTANVVYISCDRVPSLLIQTTFSRLPESSVDTFYDFTFIPSPTDDVIPANLLQDKWVNDIKITCPTLDYPLRIDPDAFIPSANHTWWVSVSECELGHLDFSFLGGFNAELTNLAVQSSTNIQSIQTLPQLARLEWLNFESCRGFPNIDRFPALDLLRILTVSRSDLDDEGAERILSSLSVGSPLLWQLQLISDLLTRIPRNIYFIQNLAFLELDGNNISVITSGSLSFSGPTLSRALYLQAMSLTLIEPGAFQGDYSRNSIVLNNNNLTRFEASVFKTVLEQMVTDIGIIYIYENSMECDCHLAWLIRDNRHLMDRVALGFCSNGTRFEELDPMAFTDCPSV